MEKKTVKFLVSERGEFILYHSPVRKASSVLYKSILDVVEDYPLDMFDIKIVGVFNLQVLHPLWL